ncbi:PREDICTED: 28S ribosomal protein S15, mitochondrial [Nicrophorus vespilloides]|uniref:Small ribosomal subunit protein uS15m n=1 Tax=Nicrophorus vespilloides TaxID=110193 RepID=A0ABM1MTI7_NICVS|nr:PREDICTED: 28S ribosomal protein S15, mitochondrial [Nicrophorus vespilloides]
MNAICSSIKLIPSNLSNLGSLRNYAFKSDLKIKWTKPEKIACFRPEKSGDLEGMPDIDKSRYPLQFKNCKELENADENVKRLFSLQFHRRSQHTNVYINDMMDQVRRHPMDKGSMEARIARWTGAIRSLQIQMDVHPRNKKAKVNLKELIEKRNKHLKYLRNWDYRRFEWLLENLQIAYKPVPSEYERVSRKGSLTKLTQIYCDNVVQERLDTYREQLQEEQPKFLEEKINTLEFLQQEQKDCGVEVTITQEDIDKVKEKLKVLLEEKAKKAEDLE